MNKGNPETHAPSPAHFLACDLGAESGRLMLGTLAGDKVSLEELHRFPNGPVKSGDSLQLEQRSAVQ